MSFILLNNGNWLSADRVHTARPQANGVDIKFYGPDEEFLGVGSVHEFNTTDVVSPATSGWYVMNLLSVGRNEVNELKDHQLYSLTPIVAWRITPTSALPICPDIVYGDELYVVAPDGKVIAPGAADWDDIEEFIKHVRAKILASDAA